METWGHVPALSGALFCRTGLAVASKYCMTYMQHEVTPTGKQHSTMASCLGVKISLLDLGDPSSTPWSISGLQKCISWLLKSLAALARFILPRFPPGPEKPIPSGSFAKLMCVSNQKNTLRVTTSYQNEFSEQTRVQTHLPANQTKCAIVFFCWDFMERAINCASD